jgi:hypothetical protein
VLRTRSVDEICARFDTKLDACVYDCAYNIIDRHQGAPAVLEIVLDTLDACTERGAGKREREEREGRERERRERERRERRGRGEGEREEREERERRGRERGERGEGEEK